MENIYKLWHRFDSNNVKYIKRFNINTVPDPLYEDGFTEWRRGTGPHSELALHNLRVAQAKYCRGVPKSIETKEKMRLAKLGVPKTEQHKLNMKLSHQRRHQLQREQNATEQNGATKKKLQREPYTN